MFYTCVVLSCIITKDMAKNRLGFFFKVECLRIVEKCDMNPFNFIKIFSIREGDCMGSNLITIKVLGLQLHNGMNFNYCDSVSLGIFFD